MFSFPVELEFKLYLLAAASLSGSCVFVASWALLLFLPCLGATGPFGIIKCSYPQGCVSPPTMWQAIFLTYGKMEPHTADRVAEMLGFNPDLVMPRLRAHAATSAPLAGAEPGAASAGSTA